MEAFLLRQNESSYERPLSDPFLDAFCELKSPQTVGFLRLFGGESSDYTCCCYTNLVHTLLESCARCTPIPLFTPTTYLHLTKEFEAGPFCSHLLLQFLSSTPDSSVRQQVSVVLLRLYELMDDPVMAIGVLQSHLFPERPLSAVYYELNGKWRQAISSYDSVSTEPLSSWAQARATYCRQNLRQWRLIIEQQCNGGDLEMVCEGYAHLNDWK